MSGLTLRSDADGLMSQLFDPPRLKWVRVGFTGSRTGLTDAQAQALRDWLSPLKDIDVVQLLHGDCVGADAQAHAIAVELGFAVTLYPPADDTLRAFCKSAASMKPSPYLTRNAAIVRDCDTLVACPTGSEPCARRAGGTWFTIREAR